MHRVLLIVSFLLLISAGCSSAQPSNDSNSLPETKPKPFLSQVTVIPSEICLPVAAFVAGLHITGALYIFRTGRYFGLPKRKTSPIVTFSGEDARGAAKHFLTLGLIITGVFVVLLVDYLLTSPNWQELLKLAVGMLVATFLLLILQAYK